MPLVTTARPRPNITGVTTVAVPRHVTSNFFNDSSDSPLKNGLTACAGVLFIILMIAVSLLLYCMFKRSTLRKAQKAAALNRRQARESGGAVTGGGAPSKPLSDVFVVDITKKPARKPSIPDAESAANYSDATVGDKKRLVEGGGGEGHRKYNSRLKGHQGHSSSEYSGGREVRAVSSSTSPPPYPHDEISHDQGHASTSQSHRSARSRPSSAATGEGQGEGRSGSAASLRVHNEKLPPPAPSSESRKDKRESSTGAKKRRQNFRKMSEESLIGTSTAEDDEEVVLYSTTGSSSSSSPKHARDATSSKTESSTIQRISEEYQTTATDEMSVTSTRHHSEAGSQGEDRTYAEIADTSPSNISSEGTNIKQPHQQRPASAGTAKPPLPPDGAKTHHHGHQSRSRSESVDGGRVIASKPPVTRGDATYAQVSAMSTERVPKKKSYLGAGDGTGNGAGAEEADDEISEAASEDKDQPDLEADKQDEDAGRRKRPPVDKRRRAASADAKKKVAFEPASSNEQPVQQQQPLQQAVATTVAVAEGSQGQGNEPPLFFKPRMSLVADGGLGEGDLRGLQQKLAPSARHQRRHSVDHAVTLTDERSDVDGSLALTLPSALPEVVIPTARLAVSVPTTPTKQLQHGHGEVTLTSNNSETLSEDPVHPSDQHQQAHQHRGNRERRRSSSKPHPASPTAIKEDAEELSESAAATANSTSPAAAAAAAATTTEGEGKSSTSDETQQPHQLSSSGRRDSKSSSSSPQQQQKLRQRPPSASRSRRQPTAGDTTADVPAPGSHGNGGGGGGQESSSSSRPNSRRGSRQQHVTDDASGNN